MGALVLDAGIAHREQRNGISERLKQVRFYALSLVWCDGRSLQEVKRRDKLWTSIFREKMTRGA